MYSRNILFLRSDSIFVTNIPRNPFLSNWEIGKLHTVDLLLKESLKYKSAEIYADQIILDFQQITVKGGYASKTITFRKQCSVHLTSGSLFSTVQQTAMGEQFDIFQKWDV